MASRHALICLPAMPASAYKIDTRLRSALWKVRRYYDSYEIYSGRYTEHFPLRSPQSTADVRLIRARGTEGPRVAGGPIGRLDLDAMRDQAAAKAAALYDAWTDATAEMPPARPWAKYVDEQPTDSFRALMAFREQPQLRVLEDIKGSRNRQRDEEAALVVMDRAGFIARARGRAVPGRSLLELDGTWHTDPAWLNDDDAVETGSSAYHQHVNAYLDALPDDHLVIGVDCRR